MEKDGEEAENAVKGEEEVAAEGKVLNLKYLIMTTIKSNNF